MHLHDPDRLASFRMLLAVRYPRLFVSGLLVVGTAACAVLGGDELVVRLQNEGDHPAVLRIVPGAMQQRLPPSWHPANYPPGIEPP